MQTINHAQANALYNSGAAVYMYKANDDGTQAAPVYRIRKERSSAPFENHTALFEIMSRNTGTHTIYFV